MTRGAVLPRARARVPCGGHATGNLPGLQRAAVHPIRRHPEVAQDRRSRIDHRGRLLPHRTGREPVPLHQQHGRLLPPAHPSVLAEAEAVGLPDMRLRDEAEAGKFTINIPKSRMAVIPPGAFVHDLVCEDGDDILPIWSGAVTVQQGVTR